jgi:RNA polymerase sigma-70 factor (ECF subfamily)
VTPDTRSAGETSGYAESVIEACRRGERAALTQVFRNEAPYLERVLFRVVRTPSDVEDLLQLSLEQAIRAFPGFRGEAGVRTWLTRIAVRTAMHHLKHPAVRRRAELTLVEGGHAEQEEAEGLSTARVEARSSLRVLHEHLAALEPVQRMAFVLFQIEGRSMEEVAALMESGVSTTKSRVMWARRRLFERLQKDPRGRELLAAHGEDAP